MIQKYLVTQDREGILVICLILFFAWIWKWWNDNDFRGENLEFRNGIRNDYRNNIRNSENVNYYEVTLSIIEILVIIIEILMVMIIVEVFLEMFIEVEFEIWIVPSSNLKQLSLIENDESKANASRQSPRKSLHLN